LTAVIDFHSIFIPTMEVNSFRQLFDCQHSSKYLLLRFTEERNSQRLGTNWGDDKIVFFRWTILLKSFCLYC